MRITYITAGAGNRHCGACNRDVGLARALIAKGCDVQLVPLYTPLHGADGELETAPIFFGGINVYLQQHAALFRHTPRAVDRLFDSRPLLNWAASFAIETQPEQLGPMTLSMLRGRHGRQRKELLRLLDFLARGPRPDVVCLANALLSGIVPAVKERIPVPVACTREGGDDFVAAMPEPYRSEARARMRA